MHFLKLVNSFYVHVRPDNILNNIPESVRRRRRWYDDDNNNINNKNLTAWSQFRSQGGPYGMRVERVALGTCFLKVLLFPLPTTIPHMFHTHMPVHIHLPTIYIPTTPLYKPQKNNKHKGRFHISGKILMTLEVRTSQMVKTAVIWDATPSILVGVCTNLSDKPAASVFKIEQ